MVRHLTVIGFGNIGKQIASQLLHSASAPLSLNVVDPDPSIEGAYWDFQDAVELHPQHQLHWNNEHCFENSDVIFHCAGAAVPMGESRLVTSASSIEITEDIFKNQTFNKQPFIIVMANPVELIAHITQRLTNFPPSRIIGTGTMLDSLRMQRFIQRDYPHLKKVHPLLLGEHGQGAYLSLELSTINKEPMKRHLNKLNINALMGKVKNAADQIKKTQGATIYGVSFCALQIYASLFDQQKTMLPVCTYLNEALIKQLGGHQSYLSLPSKLNQEGAYALEDYPTSKDELKQLKKAQNLLDDCLPRHYH